jgi:hypothetical protein
MGLRPFTAAIIASNIAFEPLDRYPRDWAVRLRSERIFAAQAC